MADGTKDYAPWALFVILLVVAVLAFGTIFLFKKRMLQITDFITSRSSVLTGIELQIPSHNAMPIKLTIAQIDNDSLIELLRGLQ